MLKMLTSSSKWTVGMFLPLSPRSPAVWPTYLSDLLNDHSLLEWLRPAIPPPIMNVGEMMMKRKHGRLLHLGNCWWFRFEGSLQTPCSMLMR